MPLRRDDKPHSGCKVGCLHRDLIEEYYAAREAQSVRAEATTKGYETETRAYFGLDGHRAVEERVTFKSWLGQHAGGEWAALERLTYTMGL